MKLEKEKPDTTIHTPYLNNIPRTTIGVIPQHKSCENCMFRKDDKCVKTYHYISTQRQYINSQVCDINHSGWVERPKKSKGILTKIYNFLFGE